MMVGYVTGGAGVGRNGREAGQGRRARLNTLYLLVSSGNYQAGGVLSGAGGGLREKR